MNAASIAAEVEVVGGHPVSAHQIDLHGCCPSIKPLLMMIHKKAHEKFADKSWSNETKINL